jgi:hypothetical protein
MDHDLICSWLGLPPGTWPPNHYRLLGLEPGEANAELIEERVHERLDTVRCYQMMHPEQATEAMNRLAQAFVCLTEPSSKKTYDTQLGIRAVEMPVPPVPPPVAPAPTPPQPKAPDWLSNPPPITSPREKVPTPSPAETPPPAAVPVARPSMPPVILNYSAAPPPPTKQPPPLPPTVDTPEPPAAPPMAIPLAPPLPSAPPLEPIDPFLDAAQSGTARRGIGTKRGIYRRIARTRRLRRLWNDLGKYLGSPKRRLKRSVEGPELIRLLDEITTLLRRFPPMLGEAGQPGYLVLALTQVDTIKVFQSFSPHQREALSRDWSSAMKLLTAHCDFLRRELRVMRKRTLKQRLLHAGWSLFVDQPGTVLLLLSLFAIIVAAWRYAEDLGTRLGAR